MLLPIVFGQSIIEFNRLNLTEWRDNINKVFMIYWNREVQVVMI